MEPVRHMEPEPEPKRTEMKSPKDTSMEEEEIEPEENGDSRLSVWEKMRLFEKKIQEHGHKLYRRGKSRFQTQPVTPENIAVTPADEHLDEVRAAVVSIKGLSSKKRQAPAPPEAPQQHTSSEGSGASGRSTLERVKARKVVHLHTDESVGRDKSSSPKNFGGTEEESFSESAREKEEDVERRRQARGYRRYRPKSSHIQQDSESSSAAEDTRRTVGHPETTGPHPEVTSAGVTMIETEGRLSIGERLAALKNQEEDWRRRVSKEKNLHSDPDSIVLRSRSSNAGEEKPAKLADRMSALLDSQAKWTQRVAEKGFIKTSRASFSNNNNPVKIPNTEALTVTGKLVNAGIKIIQPVPSGRVLGTPQHGKSDSDENGPPPEKPIRASKLRNGHSEPQGPKHVSILPRLDVGLDEFYQSDKVSPNQDVPRIDPGALDAVLADQTPKRIVTRNVKPPRRRTQSTPRNPIKQLAESQIVEKAYEETKKTQVLFRNRPETQDSGGRHVNGETPKRPYSATMDPILKPGNRGTQLATEALRALAAKEDFGAVKLRKADPARTPGQAPEHRPYKDLMLIQVKGKKNVQLRLVEPTWKSLNSGDCFLLITHDNVFLYEGRFSSVLERAKAKEVANFVVDTKDMGCLGSSRVIEMIEENLLASEEAEERLSPSRDRFWSLIGTGGSVTDIRVPHDLEEDQLFENVVTSGSLVYKVVCPNGDCVYKLKLSEEYSGNPLHYDMLKEDDVWVFDFGAELYVWNGRSVSSEARKAGLKLAKDLLWDRPFDTTTVGYDPFKIFDPKHRPILEEREGRPDWCVFGQVKEKMETSLFRGKFVDWPEMRSARALSVQSGAPELIGIDSRSPSPSKGSIDESINFFAR